MVTKISKFSIILLVLLLLGSTVVLAEGREIELDYVDTEHESYIEWDEMLKMLSEGLGSEDGAELQSTYNINLNVTRWAQGDSRWANDIMRTCNERMSSHGCAVTAAAMVFDYFGAPTNPGQLNRDLGNQACPLNWGAAANLYRQVGGVSTNFNPTYAQVMNAARLSLLNDIPIIVGYLQPHGEQHFVVVKGVFNDGNRLSDFLAVDPAGGVQRYLNYYDNQGWTLDRLIIYSPGN
jgi:hypothetical protein